MSQFFGLAAATTVLGIAFVFPASCGPYDSGAPATAKPAHQPAEMARSTNAAQSATQLWRENCTNCHGEDGRGGGAGTQTLLTKELFEQKYDRQFFDAIKNGVPDTGMTAFGPTMSDEQIWSLVVHVRELQNRAVRQDGPEGRPENGVVKTQYLSYKIEDVVTEGLRVPWSVDWLPDGRMLVTNRPGHLMVWASGKLTPVEGTPQSIQVGQGGMMDVAVHPDYAKDKWVYLAVTDPLDGGRKCYTMIVRGKIAEESGKFRWTENQVLWRAKPEHYTTSGIHFGCRIVFDGKGHIFFATGERGTGMPAQDLDTPYGKVFRLNEDGSVPKDNPFADKEGPYAAVWSYGHRNPQGLAIDANGTLWETEHAPRGGDELNEIVKGANYGWPVVSFGINYNDSALATPWPKEGQDFKMPVLRWLPSTAACGLDVVRQDKFAAWKGDLLSGGLAGQSLDRVRVKSGQVVEHELVLHGIGRIRDVVEGPDGFVYVVLNDPDKVVRLVPVP
ncbi:MAG: PQQ-dependent sugar dehydrogenase [Fimbriimonadaceae bacterium]|nr:PQQ-dependent sugar dehydrogenase [Fimbriimonadaceae bacterium]QYK55250.1 MAG: PQQ-dependent sugar dehydrogenase [Fimbriimonadaceae bacterium]